MTNNKLLGFKTSNKERFKKSGLRFIYGYVNCTISGVIRFFSTSNSGVKSRAPVAGSNKNRAAKNATDTLKDMRKDDIVTEKETTFRAKRVVRTSNNGRHRGVDEFIV